MGIRTLLLVLFTCVMQHTAVLLGNSSTLNKRGENPPRCNRTTPADFSLANPAVAAQIIFSFPAVMGFHEALKTEYQINRYVTCVSSLAAWYAMTLLQQSSENPNCKYQIASDKAITHTATMILLYGAGGGPGRGEEPMSSVAAERLLISLAHGALRTNNVNQLHIGTSRRGKLLGGSIYEI